jgi:hypothetical protein
MEVAEDAAQPRHRVYFAADSVGVYTSVVGLANYPTNWIQSTYGNCPSWLTGTARQQWYAERDPNRCLVTFLLISTSDVPAWCAALTNAGHSIPAGDTNLTFLGVYSNDIALAWTQPGSTVPELLLHAPTNVPALDVYITTNLMNPAGWQLYTKLTHTTDPLLLDWWGDDPTAFFAAGNPGLDTDSDGLTDAMEFFLTGTDPTLRDTLGDGLGDGTRILTYGLSAGSADSDGDGLSDAYEIAAGLNPNSADSDGDGLSDYAETVTYFGYTSPTNADVDRDGLNDYAEIITHNTYAAPFNPYGPTDAADTDNDGLSDAAEVYTNNCNPRVFDTDGDGMNDYFEVYYGLNPNDPADANQDTDGDGFSNLTEYKWSTNPTASNGYPSYYTMVIQVAGSNAVRTAATAGHMGNVFAMRCLAASNSLIRIPPRVFGTNFCERRLTHTGTAGFRINGTPVAQVASPIVIPATSNAADFIVTTDPGYAGASIGFALKDTNGQTHVGTTFYSPQITSATFYLPAQTPQQVTFGLTGTVWGPMPPDTNSCRLRVCPGTINGETAGMRQLRHTDWIRARVYGPGASPSDTTLNELDWRSAFIGGSVTPSTRGIQLAPGVHTVQVGVDANANSTLDTNEVQVSCKVYVPRVDLAIDANNDGSITTNDSQVEDVLPGKVIWADKDLYWYTGTNDSDIVPLNVTFDMGGSVVPTGCYAVLRWFTSTGSVESCVDVYTDAGCQTPLSRTGWHPVYSNSCRIGHLFDAGDTVPATLYVKASGAAMKSTNYTSGQSMQHDSIGLRCYRRDTKQIVCEDNVNVTVANRPAPTPDGVSVHFWEEEQTIGSLHDALAGIWTAITNDITTNGVHAPPYNVVYHRKDENNITPGDFIALRNRSILVTEFHGIPGYVYPVAYPATSEGASNAAAWATALGNQWATNLYSPLYTCNWVRVSTDFFAANWRAQRNANNAMLLAVSCYSAAPNPTNGLPSYVEAAGGAFACGSTNTMDTCTPMTRYSALLGYMRTEAWRTAAGAIAFYGNTWDFKFAGSGKVTLWPAVLRDGNEKAVYPTQCNTNGIVTVLFDTWMQNTTDPIMKVSGDAGLVGSGPVWLQSNGKRCGLRWPYGNDTSASVKTRMRIKAARSMAEPWRQGQTPKKFAGDGATCGMNLEWEF